jgi:hypothetical protein
MLKLDYLISPKRNLGAFTKDLLMIEYDKDVLTTAEWKYGDDETDPIDSDLKIEHIDIPRKCNVSLVSDKLLKIIELYELNEKVIQSCNTRIFLGNYNCEINETTEENMNINKDLYNFIPGYNSEDTDSETEEIE